MKRVAFLDADGQPVSFPDRPDHLIEVPTPLPLVWSIAIPPPREPISEWSPTESFTARLRRFRLHFDDCHRPYYREDG